MVGIHCQTAIIELQGADMDADAEDNIWVTVFQQYFRGRGITPLTG